MRFSPVHFWTFNTVPQTRAAFFTLPGPASSVNGGHRQQRTPILDSLAALE
jgi:hypothetical protein